MLRKIKNSFVSSLADLAGEENYVRPVVDNSNALEIKDGRHPVVEKMLTGSDRFVPNNTELDRTDVSWFLQDLIWQVSPHI